MSEFPPLIPEHRYSLYDSTTDVPWIDSIQFAAEAALTAIVDVAAANEVPLPERQIIYVGTTPQDCEQVAVSASSYGFGRPGDPSAGPTGSQCWLPGSVSLNAEITRCVPEENQARPMGRYATGKVSLPSNAAMEDHAKTVMKDMMILLEAGTVAANYPYEGAGSEASVLVTDPQSGYQTVFLTLMMQV